MINTTEQCEYRGLSGPHDEDTIEALLRYKMPDEDPAGAPSAVMEPSPSPIDDPIRPIDLGELITVGNPIEIDNPIETQPPTAPEPPAATAQPIPESVRLTEDKPTAEYIPPHHPRRGNRQEKQVSPRFTVCYIIFFCILTIGCGLLYFLTPDRSFAEGENRMLANMPDINGQAILSGNFMKDFETYLADQFPLRDDAISLKTFSDRIVGKRQENGVYIGKHNFLFDAQIAYNEEQTMPKIAAINRFIGEHPDWKAALAISPNSSYIYKEYLPYTLSLSDQKAEIDAVYDLFKGENLAKINLTAALEREKEKGTQLFYKTDHHWTTDAAYRAFEEIAKQWELETEVVTYEKQAVTNRFEGTLSGKAGVHDVTDSIHIMAPKDAAGTYIVNYESQQKKTTSLFDNAKLDEKNKYEVFVGGNFDKVIISTTCPSENTLLVVKDSFANCMLPMFTPYFSKIVVVDPRYLTDSMENIASDENFTHMLFLYNLNTFLEDTSIVNVF